MNKRLSGPDFKKCQFFTESSLAIDLLDSAGYTGRFGELFFEPACGDGQILLQAVKRYIEANEKAGIGSRLIKRGLQKDFLAYEIDPDKYEMCKKNLNSLAAQHGLYHINWRICLGDSLKGDILGGFDYIVGNPPYISFTNLSLENRLFCKEKFVSCHKGKFDYSFAFVEHCLNLLSPRGSLCFIVPSAIFKTVSGETLRQLIKPYLTYVEDGFDKGSFVFCDTPTVSATVFVCKKDNTNSSLEYHNRSNGFSAVVEKDGLTGKWCFGKTQTKMGERIEFGSVFDVHSSVATLSNSTFLVHGEIRGDYFVTDHGKRIEKEVVRPAASPFSLARGERPFIIFPYLIQRGTVVRMNETQFKNTFPLCYEYLLPFKASLLKTSKDRSALWYEYGRFQNINHICKEKLLISIMFTNSAKVYSLEAGTIPYSGIAIYQKDPRFTLADAKRVLESGSFLDFVESIGIRSSGTSYRILPSDIKEFTF